MEGNDFFHNNYIISRIYFSFIYLFLYSTGKQSSLPQIKTVGCSFHLTQSFYRNIKSIGLGPAYPNDSQTRKTCQELLSLYLLPAKKIRKRFLTIKESAIREPLLLRFCNYILNVYIDSTIWPPETWSMYMQHERTNNNVEGTHNNLKAVAGE